MKPALILTFFCFLVCNIQSQPCNSVNVTLVNQSDITGFLAQNGNCTEIIGDLVIGVGVENLDGMENIQRIGGYVSMSNCDKLQDISGLSGLNEVGSWMRIQNNAGLASLKGLDSLRNIRGDFFYIAGNHRMKNLDGLANLDSIGGIFQIWDMDSLIDIKSLAGLHFIGGDCSIFKNDFLVSLQGLDSVENITGAFRVYENNSLTDIHHLNPELKIGSQLAIYKNPELEECHSELICKMLASDPNRVFIEDNKGGCFNKELVITNCISSSSYTPDENIVFYPNPGMDNVWTNHTENIIVFTMTGNKFRELRPENNVLDVSTLPSGTYLIQCNQRIYKFIKL